MQKTEMQKTEMQKTEVKKTEVKKTEVKKTEVRRSKKRKTEKPGFVPHVRWCLAATMQKVLRERLRTFLIVFIDACGTAASESFAYSQHATLYVFASSYVTCVFTHSAVLIPTPFQG